MIQIKKPKHDNYCTCCRKPFEDSMAITFSHKDYGDSTIITLCGKCRAELMEALGKDTNVPTNSALDHIHNVVADNAFGKGYDAGYAEGYEHGRKDTATSLAMRITTRFDEVLGVEDVLGEIDNLLAVPKGE